MATALTRNSEVTTNHDNEASSALRNNSEHPEAFINQYHSNKTRQFNCAINPTKQLDKVIDDAKLPPITLEVNNSGHNVNLKCNSGTYAKLVKPVFQTLSEGFSRTVEDVICVFCPLPPGEELHNFEFNDMFKVNLFKVSSPTISIATVTITIHHTSRLIQVQSPNYVDGKTAPVWFSETFLLRFFQKFAKEKKIEIDQFNQDVLKLSHSQSVSSLPTSCGSCQKKFSSGSKPMQCTRCHLFYHLKCTVPKKKVLLFTCSSCTANICGDDPLPPDPSPLHSLAKRPRPDQITTPLLIEDNSSPDSSPRPRRIAVYFFRTCSTICRQAH